jgi:hypothetical protein
MAPGSPTEVSRVGAVPTTDHAVIRAWAERHGAEPAMADPDGAVPAMHVNDGGPAIRFNFPGASRFRPIGWEEWLARFDRERLTFVYEEEPSDRAHAIWLQKGGGDGHDMDDWLEAERQLGSDRQMLTQRYRLISREPTV